MMLRNILLSLLMTISVLSVSGQLEVLQYFQDKGFGHLSKIYDYEILEDGFIISGLIDSSEGKEAVLLRLDQNGQVLWSTANSIFLGMYQAYFFNFYVAPEGMIYGLSGEQPIFSGEDNHLWKVDMETGEVLWVSYIEYNFSGRPQVYELDEERYITAFVFNVGDDVMIQIRSKTDGSVLEEYFFDYPGNRVFDVEVDQAKNIYFSLSSGLYKFNGGHLSEMVWSKGFTTDEYSINSITGMYMDAYDQLYIHGPIDDSNNLSNLALIDRHTGEQVWVSQLTVGHYAIRDILDEGDKLKVSMRHTLIGGGFYRSIHVELDKLYGDIIWLSVEDYDHFEDPYVGDEQAGLSIASDCLGDLYSTGYYKSDNWEPANWGIMKLDGLTGMKILDHTITLDSTGFDEYSLGKVAAVQDDRPIFLGEIEIDDDDLQTQAYYVSLDSSGESVTNRHFIDEGYRQLSRVVQMERDANELHVLKQIGNDLTVDSYDAFGETNWTDNIIQDSRFKSAHMTISDENLFVVAQRTGLSDQPPYWTEETDLIAILQYNKLDGAILNYDSLNIPPLDREILDVFSADGDVFMLIVDQENRYILKWNEDSGFSEIVFLESSLLDLDVEYRPNILFDFDDESFLVFGEEDVYQVQKSTLEILPLELYDVSRIYHDFIKIDNELYIGGVDEMGQGLLTVFNIDDAVINANLISEMGVITHLELDENGDILYALTNDNGSILSRINIDGDLLWSNALEILPEGNKYPLAMHYQPAFDRIAVGGQVRISETHSDAFFSVIDIDNDSSYHWQGQDELLTTSLVSSLASLNDSVLWIGGGINTMSDSKRGFIFSLDSLFTSGSPNSTSELVALPSLQFYPNPANEQVTITGLEERSYEYELIDASGRITVAGSSYGPRITLDLVGLSEGVYIFTLYDKEVSQHGTLIISH